MPIPAPSTPRLNSLSDLQNMESSTITHQQDDRVLLNSKEFSLLFLDEDSPTGMDIPYGDLTFGTKIGSGGFKDCYQGKARMLFFFLSCFPTHCLFSIRHL